MDGGLAAQRRPLVDLDLDPVALLDLAPHVVRLGEEHVGVEREDARLRLGLEQQVEQDGLLLLERACERDVRVEDARASGRRPGSRSGTRRLPHRRDRSGQAAARRKGSSATIKIAYRMHKHRRIEPPVGSVDGRAARRPPPRHAAAADETRPRARVPASRRGRAGPWSTPGSGCPTPVSAGRRSCESSANPWRASSSPTSIPTISAPPQTWSRSPARRSSREPSTSSRRRSCGAATTGRR